MSTTRPTEIHIQSLSLVERDTMPLLCGMVYGEIFTPEMLNMRGLGIVSPGIFCGFVPSIKSGLTITINLDDTQGYSAALCQIGLQQFHIVQQHAIDVTMPTGYKWFVVLDPYYQQCGLTTQVHAGAEHDAVSIKCVREPELTSQMQVICEVDLTSGALEITEDMITYEHRNDQTFTINEHVQDEHPHAQYARTSEIGTLVDNAVASLITHDYTGDSATMVASQKALSTAIATRAAKSHTHTGDNVDKATNVSRGTVMLAMSLSDPSEDTVPTSALLASLLNGLAVAEHTHDAETLAAATETEAGVTMLSNSHESTSQTSAATPNALKNGLATRAAKEHSHQASDLPDATTLTKGIIMVTNQADATGSDTVPTSKAMALGLDGKADKAKLVESNANETIQRGGQVTTLLRNSADLAAITIDISTFEIGDEIRIFSIHPTAGNMTITNNGGMIVDLQGNGASTFALTGAGKLVFLKTETEGAVQIVEHVLR